MYVMLLFVPQLLGGKCVSPASEVMQFGRLIYRVFRLGVLQTPIQGAVTDTAYYLEHGFLGVPGWKMQFGHGYKVHNVYVQIKKVLWGGRKELLKR